MASLVAQTVKRLSAVQETWFDPLVGKIPWRRKWQPTPVFLPGESHGPRSLVGYRPWGRKELDTTERVQFHFSLFTFNTPWRRKWEPTSVFLPGKSHGWRSLEGYSPRDRQELDTTDFTSLQYSTFQKTKKETLDLNHNSVSAKKQKTKTCRRGSLPDRMSHLGEPVVRTAAKDTLCGHL